MLAAAVVGHLPLGIDDRAFTNLDDAVARLETRISCRLDQVYMSPLVAMVVDVIRNLTE